MIQGLFTPCLVIIILLNFLCELSDAIDISESNNLLSMSDNVMTAVGNNAWQPIIETTNFMTLTTAVKPADVQKLSPRNNLADTAKNKIYPQTYHSNGAANTANHDSASYDKQDVNTLTSALLSIPPTSATYLQNTENIASHIYPLPTKSNNKAKYSITRSKYLSTTPHHHQHHPYHQQQQTKAVEYKNTETLYPRVNEYQKSSSSSSSSPSPSFLTHHTTKGKHSISTQLNLNHLAKVPAHEQLKNSSSGIRYSYYLTPAATHIPTHNSSIESISKKMNVEVKTNTLNNSNNIFPIKLNSSLVNENLINNNEMKNIEKHQHQNHYPIYLGHSSDDNKSKEIDNKNLSKAIKSSVPTDMVANDATDDDDKSNFSDETVIEETFLYTPELYDIINKIRVLLGKKSDGKSDSSSVSYHDAVKAEDDINEDNDLQTLKASSHQILKVTSAAVAAGVTSALDTLLSLNMKNTLLSLAQTAGATPLPPAATATLAAAAAAASLSSLPDANITQTFHLTPINETKTSELQLLNLSPGDKTLSVIATPFQAPPSSFPLNAPTPRGLTIISSGRKFKKIKKTFQEFLLPLVLAYKLKFMTLIPLLIGGLVLLVGATGLAGFFFALFTAALSIKTEHGHAVVVKGH